MFNHKTVLKIFSLFAAVLIWMYVTGEVDPETTIKIRDIPVQFVNTEQLAENGLAVVQEEELKVSATIQGKRSDVNDVKNSGLIAYVDVAEAEKGKNQGKINMDVPVGTSLENLSKTTMKYKVQELVSEKKTVVIEFSDMESVNGKTTWLLDVVPDEVIVSGAKSSVNKVAEMWGSISALNAEEEQSKWINVPLTPVTENGDPVQGIEVSADKAKACIQILSVKSVKLEVKPENVEDGVEVDTMKYTNNIRIAGPFDLVTEIEKLQGTVDLKGMTTGGKAEIKVDLPEYVFLLNEGESQIAEVMMKKTE